MGLSVLIKASWYNIVEQDQRGVKPVVRLMLGFKSFRSALATLQGIELMQMINKGQMVRGRKSFPRGTVLFIGRLKCPRGTTGRRSNEINATEPTFS
jgi:hypothetical protein